MDVLILIGAFLVILLGAELFTNGIEWFGRKLELAEGAVGSVLAAVGTALPETMIPIIAILSGGGSAASHGIGVGAILGAPFMLSTLAMFVTGAAVLVVGRNRPKRDGMPVDTAALHPALHHSVADAGPGQLHDHVGGPGQQGHTHQSVVEARTTAPRCRRKRRDRVAHRSLDVLDRLTDRH